MAAYRQFMIHVTCRLTAKNRDQFRNPITLGNRVWTTFLCSFTPLQIWERSIVMSMSVCVCSCVSLFCMRAYFCGSIYESNLHQFVCMFPTTVARSFVSVVFVCGQLIIITTTIIKRRLISRRNMPEDTTRARKVESCPSACRCGRERRWPGRRHVLAHDLAADRPRRRRQAPACRHVQLRRHSTGLSLRSSCTSCSYSVFHRHRIDKYLDTLLADQPAPNKH